VNQEKEFASLNGSRIQLISNSCEAAQDADIIYKVLLARIILCQISRAQANDQTHFSYCRQN